MMEKKWIPNPSTTKGSLVIGVIGSITATIIVAVINLIFIHIKLLEIVVWISKNKYGILFGIILGVILKIVFDKLKNGRSTKEELIKQNELNCDITNADLIVNSRNEKAINDFTMKIKDDKLKKQCTKFLIVVGEFLGEKCSMSTVKNISVYDGIGEDMNGKGKHCLYLSSNKKPSSKVRSFCLEQRRRTKTESLWISYLMHMTRYKEDESSNEIFQEILKCLEIKSLYDAVEVDDSDLELIIECLSSKVRS